MTAERWLSLVICVDDLKKKLRRKPTLSSMVFYFPMKQRVERRHFFEDKCSRSPRLRAARDSNLEQSALLPDDPQVDLLEDAKTLGMDLYMIGSRRMIQPALDRRELQAKAEQILIDITHESSPLGELMGRSYVAMIKALLSWKYDGSVEPKVNGDTLMQLRRDVRGGLSSVLSKHRNPRPASKWTIGGVIDSLKSVGQRKGKK